MRHSVQFLYLTLVLFIGTAIGAFAQTATGHVVDAAGKPVAGATVYLYNPGNETPLKVLTTDATGSFSTTVETTVNSPSEACMIVAKGFGLSGGDWVSGENTYQLSPPETITGTVVDANQQPVSNAEVIPTWAGNDQPYVDGVPHRYSYFGLDPIKSQFTVKTGADGSYSIGGLPAKDSVDIALIDPKYIANGSSLPIGQLVAPSIIAKLGAIITGRVVRNDGKPLGVIDISAQISGGWQQGGSGVSTTAADGSYTIGQLIPGQYYVLAATPNNNSVPLDWASPKPVSVVAAVGQTATAPDLVLDSPSLLTGQVVDTVSGQPVPGVMIGIQDPPTSQSNAIRSVDVTTDSQGKFTANIWAGTLSMYVYSVPTQYVSNPYLNLPNVTVVAGQNVVAPTIKLQRGLTVTGVVVDDSGNSVPNVSLQIGAMPGANMYYLNNPPVTADKSGAFTISQLSPGAYYLDPGANWTVVSPKSFTLPSTGPITLTVKKAAVTDLVGTVVDPSGAPIPDVALTYNVSHQTPNGSWIGNQVSVSTGSDGKFTLAGVPLVPQMIQKSSITKDGYTCLSGGTITQNGNQLTIDPIVMSQLDGVITGTVFNGLNHPVSGAWVDSPTGSPNDEPVQTDQLGKFRLTGLIVGTRDLYAAKGHYYAHITVPVTVIPSNTTITLAPMPDPPAPSDIQDAIQLFTEQITESKTSGTKVEDWRLHDECASLLSAANADAGLAFLGNYTEVNSGDLNSIIPPQQAIDPVSTVKWAVPLLERTQDNGYEGSIAASLGLAVAPYDLGSARALYEIADNKIPVNHIDNNNLSDVENLTALAYVTKQSEADDLYQKVLATVNAAVAAGKTDSANSEGGYDLGVLAEHMALGKLALGLQILATVPDEYHQMAVTQMIKELVLARPADAITVFHTLDATKNGKDEFLYNQCLSYVIPIMIKTDPLGTIAAAKSVHDSVNLSEALVTVADALPLDQAVPLYKDAEDDSVNQRGWQSTPASVAAHAYLRDNQLGSQLFATALIKSITYGQNNQQSQSPSTAEFAFYYARLDPGYSRILLESQFARDQANPPPYEAAGTSAIQDVAAMASISTQRALELAHEITDPDQRFGAELKVGGYLLLSQSERNMLPFYDWALPYSDYSVGQFEPW